MGASNTGKEFLGIRALFWEGRENGFWISIFGFGFFFNSTDWR